MFLIHPSQGVNKIRFLFGILSEPCSIDVLRTLFIVMFLGKNFDTHVCKFWVGLIFYFFYLYLFMHLYFITKCCFSLADGNALNTLNLRKTWIWQTHYTSSGIIVGKVLWNENISSIYSGGRSSRRFGGLIEIWHMWRASKTKISGGQVNSCFL